MVAELVPLDSVDIACPEAVTRLQTSESCLQQQLLESQKASKECLRQTDEQMTNMATAHAAALKARDDENVALEQWLTECQSTKEQQATEALARLVDVATQKDAEINAHRQEKANVQQQLVQCQASMKKMKADTQTLIAFHTTQKNFAIKKARQETATSEQNISTLQAELTSLQARHNSAQKMMKQESESVSSQLGKIIAEKDAELEKLRSGNSALTVKIVALAVHRNETAKRSRPQSLFVTTSEAASTAPQQINSKTQVATEEAFKLTIQLADKNAYLETACTELHSIKREWTRTYAIIRSSNGNWVTIGRRLGKTKFNCEHQIAEMRQGDPESMYVLPSEMFILTSTQ